MVAIAPCDGQIEGAGHGPNRLEGVDYLTIQGGLDADMAWWSSLRQFARTSGRGQPTTFKAGIWIRRANHGRFNTEWDLGDAGPQADWLLDQAALLSPAEQQDVAKTAIGGFLEASLLGRDGYRSMFAVPAAGRDWLPYDAYVTRLVEGSTAMLADFDRPVVRDAHGRGLDAGVQAGPGDPLQRGHAGQQGRRRSRGRVEEGRSGSRFRRRPRPRSPVQARRSVSPSRPRRSTPPTRSPP